MLWVGPHSRCYVRAGHKLKGLSSDSSFCVQNGEKMKKILKKTKDAIIKIDDFREEKLENFIADEIFSRLDENDSIDKLEKKAILAGITAANAYLTTYGVPVLPEDIKEQIAAAAVKSLGKANKLLQNQLKKTSNLYKKRSKGEEG